MRTRTLSIVALGLAPVCLLLCVGLTRSTAAEYPPSEAGRHVLSFQPVTGNRFKIDSVTGVVSTFYKGQWMTPEQMIAQQAEEMGKRR